MSVDSSSAALGPGWAEEKSRFIFFQMNLVLLFQSLNQLVSKFQSFHFHFSTFVVLIVLLWIMGNQVGKGANRMAIAAMSNVTHIEKRELAALQSKLREIASREGSPMTVNRTEFTEATTAIGINQNDSDILDRLFTMFDKTGDDVINFKEFVVGISPLISGTPFDKLDFALRLYDLDGTGSVKANELTNVLSNINRVASYFGDPVMTEEQLSNLVCTSFAVWNYRISM